MNQATVRTLRTVVQTAVGIGIALPALVDGGALPRSLPWLGAALTVSGLLSRAMAYPAVQALLPAWLSTSDAPTVPGAAGMVGSTSSTPSTSETAAPETAASDTATVPAAHDAG